jgi:hypothetical protein
MTNINNFMPVNLLKQNNPLNINNKNNQKYFSTIVIEYDESVNLLPIF